MKRLLCSFLAAALALSFSVLAAADTFPWFEQEDGNTYLRTFMVKDAQKEQLEFWKEWKESGRNVMFMGAGQMFTCVIVPEDATYKLSYELRPESGVKWLKFTANKPMKYLYFSSDPQDESRIVPYEFGTIAPNTPVPAVRYIVCETLFPEDYRFEDFGWNYFIEYEGVLYIVDDLGEEGGGGADFLSWLKRLWGWLSSFWDKLVEVLLSLFVPGEGYFDDWFRELREAFTAKLGGLDEVFSELQAIFRDPSGAGDLVIAMPAGMIYEGSPGAEVSLIEFMQPILKFVRPVLTGLVAILTVIGCYKRVIALVNV